MATLSPQLLPVLRLAGAGTFLPLPQPRGLGRAAFEEASAGRTQLAGRSGKHSMSKSNCRTAYGVGGLALTACHSADWWVR